MKKITLGLVGIALVLTAIAMTPTNIVAQTAQPPEGLYVTDLRIAPDPPVRGTPLTFTGTFSNTAKGDQNMSWRVLVYKASNMNIAVGDTAATLTTFAPGSSQKTALGYWQAGLGFPCELFVARPVYLDINNLPVSFKNTDGSIFEKAFTVCARDDLPKPAPAPGTPSPNLYVTDLRVSPNPPTRGTALSFYATFLNTATGDQNPRWSVQVYRAGAPLNAFGETTAAVTVVPPGTREVLSLGSWGIPLGGPCEYMFARVTWYDGDTEIPFRTQDGKVFEKGFTVCAPIDLPPAPPSSPAPIVPAPRPSPQPGLFVTDLRTQPAPIRGTDLVFYPTFQNTLGVPMTFTWRVFIFKADTPNRSYSDTTYATTMFQPGTAEVKSDGDWNLGPGACDWFFARVGWLDSENKINWFMKPDGTVFEKGLTMCGP